MTNAARQRPAPFGAAMPMRTGSRLPPAPLDIAQPARRSDIRQRRVA